MAYHGRREYQGSDEPPNMENMYQSYPSKMYPGNPNNVYNNIYRSITPNYVNPIFATQSDHCNENSPTDRNPDYDNFQRYRQERSRFGKMNNHQDQFEKNQERTRNFLNMPKKKMINAEIRTSIIPRSPIIVLTELVGYVPFDVVENSSENDSKNNTSYIACCEIDEEIFSGKGPTKFIAKNICAEHAIKEITIKRHALANAKLRENGRIDPLKDYVEEEQAAWKGLACVGLFKMFNDWSAEGFEVPEWFFKPPSSELSEANKIPVRSKKHIPKNPTDHHPVSLLTMMSGITEYTDMGSVGEGMIKIFTMSVELDPKTESAKVYTGQGRTKKDAKKNCALKALKDKYDIEYPPGLYPS